MHLETLGGVEQAVLRLVFCTSRRGLGSPLGEKYTERDRLGDVVEDKRNGNPRSYAPAPNSSYTAEIFTRAIRPTRRVLRFTESGPSLLQTRRGQGGQGSVQFKLEKYSHHVRSQEAGGADAVWE